MNGKSDCGVTKKPSRTGLSRVAAILLIVIMALYSCGGEVPAEGEGTQNDRSVPVEVMTVTPASAEFSLAATGMIKPVQEVIVSTEISGTVASLEKEVGDPVKMSDVLVNLDRELKELEVRRIVAQSIKAKASYDKAAKDRQRMEQLVKTNDIAQNEYDSAVLQEEIARGDLEMTEAALESARKQLRDTGVRSPIAGVVAQRYIELGTAVMPGDRIAKVIDLSRVKISVGIAETDIGDIRAGQKVSVSADGAPGAAFSGSIYTIGPEAEEATRTFPVEIFVPNDSRLSLRAGMAAQIRIITDILQDALLVPQDAILGEGEERFVYQIDSDIAHRVPVRTGKSQGNEVMIIGGLSAGDVIAIVGHRQLSEGAKVKVLMRQ